jgi:cell division protein FtsQ
MKFLVWTNIRLVLIITVMVFLYSFTSVRNSHRKLKKAEVIFIGNSKNFLKQETVNKLLIENNSDVKTIEKLGVNLNKLENSINKHQMVKHSQIYVSVDGVLKAEVEQKTPIARFVNQGTSFYIDNEGSTMAISELFTSRVMLVTGLITPKNKQQVIALLNKIDTDEFLKKNIIGIQILSNDDVIMSNRIYNYQIDFGKMINIDEKFENYKAFFQKTSKEKVLEKYKKINLKFSHQVVCTK